MSAGYSTDPDLLSGAARRGLAFAAALPAYHPTHEEVLRRALRATLRECDVDADELEAIRCKETPVEQRAE